MLLTCAADGVEFCGSNAQALGQLHDAWVTSTPLSPHTTTVRLSVRSAHSTRWATRMSIDNHHNMSGLGVVSAVIIMQQFGSEVAGGCAAAGAKGVPMQVGLP